MDGETPYLDGNAAGGEIGALLAIDVTMARGECVGCGADMPLATARMYGPAPGPGAALPVLRCRAAPGGGDPRPGLDGPARAGLRGGRDGQADLPAPAAGG